MTCPFCQDTGIQAKGFIEVGCGHAEYEVACQICKYGRVQKIIETSKKYAPWLDLKRKAEVKP
jgi:hypothetical protein